MTRFYRDNDPDKLRAELEAHIAKLNKVFKVVGRKDYAGVTKIIVDRISFHIYLRYQKLGAIETKNTWMPIDALEENFKEIPE